MCEISSMKQAILSIRRGVNSHDVEISLDVDHQLARLIRRHVIPAQY